MNSDAGPRLPWVSWSAGANGEGDGGVPPIHLAGIRRIAPAGQPGTFRPAPHGPHQPQQRIDLLGKLASAQSVPDRRWAGLRGLGQGAVRWPAFQQAVTEPDQLVDQRGVFRLLYHWSRHHDALHPPLVRALVSTVPLGTQVDTPPAVT
ncbi:hypothetical protein ACFWIO_23560 [Streptomyces diastatochromogenes]|uniref:hypothetical protein n=1 Tax=Streptomyces diastatochromogenes TaxID=42236 RepID=UPI0036678D33